MPETEVVGAGRDRARPARAARSVAARSHDQSDHRDTYGMRALLIP
jgi:hypothetical protein